MLLGACLVVRLVKGEWEEKMKIGERALGG